ncbi:type I polyketide synthase [Polyangium sp. y55x31]|uniref:type I polyketide synthase n=1 Tax=Polyangium sp. y55x31 TaxID=3042688 RepID=UPI0024822419|nr:type I polyketide synthase [Polyangium sp. y55x31]MDI1475029.1 type I polyketide synthase [Polyangium sp. y55x31]
MDSHDDQKNKLRETLLRSLREVERLRGTITKLEAASREPLAIVGLGLRLPGGIVDIDGLWRFLTEGEGAVSRVPRDRWDADAFYDPDPDVDGKSYVRDAAFLENVDLFDAALFGISPREARTIDPRHRLLLEATWNALEDAGLVPSELRETRTGVFVGIGPGEYDRLPNESPEAGAHVLTGTQPAFAAGRIAFTFGLQGPALSVDTACSSSLVALHLACQALRRRECNFAIAAGAQVMVGPEAFILLSRTRALASDGRSKTFSAAADGYGRGEGVVVLVLERLEDALSQGRTVLAVIRGSAVNHDGESSGITAPNGTSQQQVLRAALEDAALAPTDVDFVECHGTGTSLGDPIEVHALSAVYAPGRSAERPLLLGAIKTQIGHLEAASGLAGVAKMIASLRRGALPPTLHTTPRNPHIDWAGLPVHVVDSLSPWPRHEEGRKRRAGVSAFGLSGTNAHVLLEEAPPPAAPAEVRPSPERTSWQPMLVSGNTPQALRAQAERLRVYLEQRPDLDLVDVAHSLSTGRTHFDHRAALLVDARGSLLDALSAVAEGRAASTAVIDHRRRGGKLALLFTGQGSQYVGMGRALYETYPVFREAFDATCAKLDGFLDRPLAALVFAEKTPETSALLERTQYTQPALFALEVSLFRLLSSWGIEPDVLMGHSIGELAAAHVAGVLNLEDACKLVAARGKLMGSGPEGGAMVAVQASEEEIRPLITTLEGKVDIAALNGPRSTVIAGDEDAVLAVAAELATRGRKTTRLSVSHAFHSPRMDGILAAYRRVVDGVALGSPRIPIVSTVTGKRVSAEELRAPEYWVRQIRSAVRFLDGIQSLEAEGVAHCLELGPEGVLSAAGPACLSEESEGKIKFFPALRKEAEGTRTLVTALAGLHVRGVNVDWRRFFETSGGRRVPLPTYAFQRERHWLEPARRPSSARATPAGRYALAGERLELPDGSFLHRVEIGPGVQPYLADHVVYGRIVVAGAVHVSILLAVAASYWPGQPIELGQIQFLTPVSFGDAQDHVILHVHLVPRSGDGAGYSAALTTRSGDSWTTHATATLGPAAPGALLHLGPVEPPMFEASEMGRAHVDVLRSIELEWGPRWWWLHGVLRPRTRTTLGRLAPPEGVSAFDAPVPGPLIDNAFGLELWSGDTGANGDAVPRLPEGSDVPRLPFAVERLVWSGRPIQAALAEHSLREGADPRSDTSRSDLAFWDAEGEPIAQIEGFTTRRAPADRFLGSPANAGLFAVTWVEPAPSAPRHPLAAALLGKDCGDIAAALEQAGVRVERHADVDALRAALDQGRDIPELLVLAALSSGEPVDVAREAHAATEEALAWLKAYLGDGRCSHRRIVVLTRRAIATRTGEDVEDLAHAPVWGLVRAAQAEFPERAMFLVDVDDAASLAALPGALTSDEPQMALRNGAGRVPRLAKMDATGKSGNTPFDREGTVLVTGGTGALGAHLARHLVAKHGVRHLLLVSRQGGDAPSAPALLAELREAGADVRLAACDVADRDALGVLLRTIPAEHPLTAVIHAAGTLDDGVLMTLDPERVRRVLRPKIDAAWALHELTQHCNLSAFVLFSSLSGVLGNAGQANYSAANTFLDALVGRRRARGQTGVSLAWGPWAEGGMAAHLSDALRSRLSHSGLFPLSAEQGTALFDAVLGVDDALVAPIRLDTAALDRSGESVPVMLRGRGRARSSRATAEKTSTAPAILQRLSSLPVADRIPALLDLVREEAAAVLGGKPEALEADRPLSELGLDSLLAIELRNRLGKTTASRLPATLLFDHPTPIALARYLEAQVLSRAGAAQATSSVQPKASVTDASDAIAIVAMSCRFPGGVESPEELWALLETGTDAISGFPTDRGWDLDSLYDPDPDARGKTYVREGGFLRGAADFDAEFFGITPREALAIDPQQRLLLETTWEAFEQAGIEPASLQGSATGVFVGVMYNDYGARLPEAPAALEGYVAIGSAPSIASGRIAYTFGLEGPAVTVDTACSSSLVAVHLACQALRNGECDLALAGGVTTMATPASFIEFSRQRGLAKDGRCKSFSAKADGAAWSEGAGLLLLERLADARRKGHRILAVVRGSALNQDGKSQGITAPNGPAQERVIKQALASAGLSFADVDAVEAHGTGTTLGDPIEAQALLATYGSGHTADAPLWLGSIKSNFGHTQAAAGVAGIMKMVLGMQRGVLPKTLHADEPSPHVDWSSGSIRLLRDAAAWERRRGPRRAGISSFGISGTNAHVILEEAPEPSPGAAERASPMPSWLPFVVSAKTPDVLRRQAERLRGYVLSNPSIQGLDVASSLLTSRTHFEHRAAVIAKDTGALVGGLSAIARGEHGPGVVVDRQRRAGKLAFLYTGQGSQHARMGKELYATYPVFREAFERACAGFDGHLEARLVDVVFAVEGTTGEALLGHTRYAQPALFALEYALTKLVESFGVRPDFLCGHSIGELVAAHIGGVMSLEDACTVVAARGRLMGELPEGGAMVAVEASEADVAALVGEHGAKLDIAAINGPASTVISGDEEAVLAVAERIRARGRKVSRLAVSHAFHSPRMDGMLEAFRRVVEGVKLAPPRIPIVSNVTGKRATAEELCTAAYWVRQVRRAVRWRDGMQCLEAEGVDTFFELGPQGVLTGLGPACLADDDRNERAFLPALRKNASEAETFVTALARLHTRGFSVDASAFFAPHGGRRVPLPTYGFSRRRYWLDAPKRSRAAMASAGLADATHPLLQASVAVAATDEHVFTGRLSPSAHPWLARHVVFGTNLLPGAALVELALFAAQHVGLAEVETLTIQAPMVIPDAGALHLQLVVGAQGDAGTRSLTVHSRLEGAPADAPWTLHATGTLAPGEGKAPSGLHDWPPPGAEPIDIGGLYERLADVGLGYDGEFRGLCAAFRRGSELFAEVELPEGSAEGGGSFGIHPALLDAALHVATLETAVDADKIPLPFSWERVSLHATGATRLRVRLSRREGSDAASFHITDERGEPVATIGSLHARPASAAQIRDAVAPHRSSLHRVEWRPLDTPEARPPSGRLVLLGPTDPGLDRVLREAGWSVETHAGIDALKAALDGGAPVPDLLVVAPRPERGTNGDLAADLRDATHRMVALVQAWLGDARGSATKLVMVTQRAVATRSDEGAVDLLHAPLVGLLRSLQAEAPERRVSLVDLDEHAASLEALPLALASDEGQIAIRGGRAVVPRLARVPAASGPATFALDPDKTVLITGGTGALGALVARHLVARYGARHLLLVSRSGGAAPGAEALANELRAAGATVTFAACDVGDGEALERLLATIPEAFPLNAVFHTAGVLDDGLFPALDAARIDRVFRPKVDAALALHALTQGRELSAFVLFSSLAGVLGNAGQASYAAANALLDALASHRQAAGQRALSLAWGPWAEEGMAARLSDADRARLARHGLLSFSTGEGLAALDAALLGVDACVVPVRLDLGALASRPEALPAMLRGLVRAAPRRVPEATSASADLLKDRLSSLSEAEQTRALLELVRKEVSTVMGRQASAIEPDRPLQELGLDSLMALDLRNRLGAATALRLPATLLFDQPTPAAIARWLRAEIVPAKRAPASLGAALDTLEALIAGIPAGDDVTWGNVDRRLRALLSKGRASDARAPEALAPKDLEAASNDELFGILDRELEDMGFG